jgi:hypothetical protein
MAWSGLGNQADVAFHSELLEGLDQFCTSAKLSSTAKSRTDASESGRALYQSM